MIINNTVESQNIFARQEALNRLIGAAALVVYRDWKARENMQYSTRIDKCNSFITTIKVEIAKMKAKSNKNGKYSIYFGVNGQRMRKNVKNWHTKVTFIDYYNQPMRTLLALREKDSEVGFIDGTEDEKREIVLII